MATNFGGFNLPDSQDLGITPTGGNPMDFWNSIQGAFVQGGNILWQNELRKRQKEEWKQSDEDRYINQGLEIIAGITWDEMNEQSMRTAGEMFKEAGTGLKVNPNTDPSKNKLTAKFTQEFTKLHNDLEKFLTSKELRHNLSVDYGYKNMFHPDNFITKLNSAGIVIGGPDPSVQSPTEMINQGIKFYEEGKASLLNTKMLDQTTLGIIDKRIKELENLRQYVGFGYDGIPGNMDDIITESDYKRYQNNVSNSGKLAAIYEDIKTETTDLNALYDLRLVFNNNVSNIATYENLEYKGLKGTRAFDELEVDIINKENFRKKLQVNAEALRDDVYGSDLQASRKHGNLSTLTPNANNTNQGNNMLPTPKSGKDYAGNSSHSSKFITQHKGYLKKDVGIDYFNNYNYEVPQGNPDNVGFKDGIIRPNPMGLAFAGQDRAPDDNIWINYSPEQLGELVAKGYLTDMEVTQWSQHSHKVKEKDMDRYFQSRRQWENAMMTNPKYNAPTWNSNSSWLGDNQGNINQYGLTDEQVDVYNNFDLGTDNSGSAIHSQYAYLKELVQNNQSYDFSKMVEPMIHNLEEIIQSGTAFTSSKMNYKKTNKVGNKNQPNLIKINFKTTGNAKQDQIMGKIEVKVNKYLEGKQQSDKEYLMNFYQMNAEERAQFIEDLKKNKGSQELIQLLNFVDKNIKNLDKVK